ncbi:MAG: phospho-sugar mutase [Zhenhengia sp.]|uniref:phosphoglucomutase (alpha-D-glucose-1,6-bisphosphate-dependent) n=1 Tax=Zhenhengia yiwuensis TaxID=2763666 RepID=A0A926ID02_9FIRM|nr:phospho-sugar mutase [Zhenhengia yiwuensis]MBC8578349.1 phospho-sugar mutase [Zhenhengia yiwuensis]MBS5799641.1 phospho-sugar mutase [Clostridiales bacterium]
MDFRQGYNRWLNEEKVDEALKNELQAIENEKEIEDRFYKNLEFGTGGLRGKIAAGSNRMNVYTIGKATQGLATYLLKHKAEPSVAIAYDSRNMSKEFADQAASVLAANGVKVFLYPSLRPTPMLSFTVRHLETDAGIVITASHNPKEYNGYKVYGNDGGQITDEAAKEILSYIDAADIFEDVKVMTLEKAEKEGKLEYITEEVDKAYYHQVETLCIRKDLIKEKASELKIIYTPIHGSGNIPVRTMLNKLGFTNVAVVKEQELPDGNFPTAPYPNPEDKRVFELAIEMAKETAPDLIFGTDPDCDRIGVVVKESADSYKVLTGNQVGILLSDYILNARKEMGTLSGQDTIVKTIVTSDMVKPIATHYGTQVMDVLTGFKYIGEKIKEFLETGANNFVFGYEESYGYLSGDFVRDKDAVIASVLIAEMALYYRTQGKNLYEALEDLFKQYGYYREDLVSIQMEGKDGQEKIQAIISNLRENAPKEVGGIRVVRVEDYKLSKAYNVLEGAEEAIFLPTSNVMKFILEDGSWFVVRPSGTEPKMKIYVSIIGQDEKDATNKVENFKKQVLELVENN